MKDVTETDLSGEWTIWFDDAADWASEKIYLPDTPITDISIHGPSGGWLRIKEGAPITVPAVTDDVRASFHGVSWWSRNIDLSGCKHALLRFEAARLRAEIFLDGQLIGYDIEGYTPFEVRIPDALNSAGEHRLDVRITNPGGSDNWEDLNPIRWSGLTLPSSQDFGGIWQPVSLIEYSALRISDLWVQPSLTDKTIAVIVEIEGNGASHASITVTAPDGTVVCTLPFAYDAPQNLIHETIRLDQPLPHGVYDPQLYTATLAVSHDELCDVASSRFAFRELAIREGGLHYNKKPIYLSTSISWSLYSNGPLGSAEEVAREVDAIRQMGQNMLTAHRRPANPALIDALDEAGILLYQEPGGLPALRDRMGCGNWLPPEELSSAVAFARLRIERLWRRDRSRACLVWWNLANECLDIGDGYAGEPAEELLQTARALDDSRITSWTSGWGPSPAHDANNSARTATFDFHTVLNWPSIWHRQLDAEIAAVKPGQPMPYISGESQNFTSLAGLGDLAQAAAERAIKRPADKKLIAWYDQLGRDLDIIDPDGNLGGQDSFCASTAKVQTNGVARLVRHHRANPDCDGLAINGWHSHPQIGTMGIVQVDRQLAVDTRVIAEANAPVQVVLSGVRHDVAPGGRMRLQPIVINDPHIASLSITLRLTLGGIEVAPPIISQTSGQRCDMLVAVEFTVPHGAIGLLNLEIKGYVGDIVVSDSFDILVTPDAPLDLSSVHLFDPREELAHLNNGEAISWRLGTDAPSLLCANNLRVVQALLDGKPRRSAVLMRPELPAATNIVGAPGDLAKHGLANVDAHFADVKGDWNGGWAFSTGHGALPSLSHPSIWTSHHWRIFPRYMMVGIHGEVVTGAASFEEATLYETGQLRAGATTIIIEKQGCEVLLTTLPLADAASSSPLARRSISEIAAWLLERK
jgi:hypothetical protein